VQKRNATTTTASTMKSKASEGLTKVTSSASETVSKATGAVSDAANNATGRTGKMIHAVQCRKLCDYCVGMRDQSILTSI
jgi:DNA topoisomerase IA